MGIFRLIYELGDRIVEFVWGIISIILYAIFLVFQFIGKLFIQFLNGTGQMKGPIIFSIVVLLIFFGLYLLIRAPFIILFVGVVLPIAFMILKEMVGIVAIIGFIFFCEKQGKKLYSKITTWLNKRKLADKSLDR